MLYNFYIFVNFPIFHMPLFLNISIVITEQTCIILILLCLLRLFYGLTHGVENIQCDFRKVCTLLLLTGMFPRCLLGLGGL